MQKRERFGRKCHDYGIHIYITNKNYSDIWDFTQKYKFIDDE